MDKIDRQPVNNTQALIPDIAVMLTGPFPDWPPGVFCFFLLMYLISLSKSNLPWEIKDYLFNRARLRS